MPRSSASRPSGPADARPSPPPSWRAPELWGGVECTVNRVGDRYLDQLERTGHASRLDDLDRFAELGVRALRYPVPWERVAPDGPGRADWRWPDERLGRLRELGIAPIVGLVHHGSGPPHTCLTDPSFADGLARYAGAVARRYPWVQSYTPVNEPLTTARFSGLYGLWYPHARDEASFARALVNQCRAVVLAMRAIREVNPGAQLVQTDDLGKVFSTRRLAYQAEFENERRWITWDLLAGRVTPGHAFWDRLLAWGIGERDLRFFSDQPCPPDVIGVNYYVTSERYLDHRLARYPSWLHGGNGQDAYVDTEAVRARATGIAGPRRLLKEAWDRYGIPLAVTEAHLGCSRDEQLRWLLEVWDAAGSLSRAGVPVRAVTAWSLLGAYDWDSLLTRDAGHYEPGVFDLRGGRPRPTALAGMMRGLAATGRYDHPVLDGAGWWRRPVRLLHPLPGRTLAPAGARVRRGRRRREVLIAGATGTLGRALARVCAARGLPFRLLGRGEMDVADVSSVRAALEAVRPWAVVNAAGYVRVDDAEAEEARCFRENADGPAVLARACSELGILLATFSSDLVFGGEKDEPYLEGDPVSPLNAYGRSKVSAEARVLEMHSGALVLRTSAFFGPWDEHNFVTVGLRALADGLPWVAADDATVSPTYVPDLAHAALDLLIDGESGVWHLATPGAVTWAELARRAAEMHGADPGMVVGVPTAEFGLAAPRPRYSVLGSERGVLLLPLEAALARYFEDRRAPAPDRVIAVSA